MLILALDHDSNHLCYIRDALTVSGVASIATGSPEEALRVMERQQPHLVLMDPECPDADGTELLREVLDAAGVPVIFLCDYGHDDIIAQAFDLGAVDCLVWPFSPAELLARIRAALRGRTALEPFSLGELTIDYVARRVTLAGQAVHLTPAEYRLLAELSANAPQTMSYERLLSRVWGVKSFGDVRPMRTIVNKLRRKLGDDASEPTYIFTEPRVGYRMPKGEASERAG